MTTATLISLFIICAVSVWTPGPNNTLLASSGARFGLRKTHPHIMGVAFGFSVMMFFVGLGLGQLFQEFPIIAEVLRWIGVGILLWLAWSIFTASIADRDQDNNKGQRPWRFYQALIFQWINPKAWIMAISVTSQFVTAADSLRDSTICAGAFLVTGLTSAYGWSGIGVMLQGWLRVSNLRMLVFNRLMAILLAVAVIPLVTSSF